MNKRFCIVVLGILLVASVAISAETYEESVNAWHQSRIERLTRSDGWLTLVGLHWIGKQAQSWPDIGEARLEDELVLFKPAPGVMMDPPAAWFSQELSLDDKLPEGQPIFRKGTRSFYVVRRGPRIGFRVKDSRAETLQNFSGVERFPIDPEWKLYGTFEPVDSRLAVKSVVGVSTDEASPGFCHLEYQGKSYKLRLLGEPEDSSFFLVFSDATAGKSTYGACRFLSVKREAGNRLLLDFNKSVNPPCAFTHFATCPLPLPENVLPFEISAGEKKTRHHD